MVVFVVAMLCFASVLLRLTRLQVVEQEMWLRESERSSARFESRSFSRGWILDRNGQPFAAAEEAHDLVFAYRDWRRDSVAGQACLAWWTLEWNSADDDRPSMALAYQQLELGVAGLGEVSLDTVAAVQPRQRRIDFGFYLSRLFGRGVWDELRTLLALGHPPQDFRLNQCADFAAGLDRCLQRADREAGALADLRRVTGITSGELLSAMDKVANKALQRVARVQQRTAEKAAEPPTLREQYRHSQELHVNFDSDRGSISESVPYDTTTLVAIRGGDIPGFQIETEERRVYLASVADVAPLIIGKVGSPGKQDMDPAEANRIELADLASLEDLTAEELTRYEELRISVRETDYRDGEERGSLGLERAFEVVLRGRRGWATRTIDDLSTHHEERNPLRGLDVSLTLDISLQRAAEKALDAVFAAAPSVPGQAADSPSQWMGAIVVLDPRTGHILVAATSPRPTRHELSADYNRLSADTRTAPMSRRAFDSARSVPAPGSTFKPAAALAALSAGVIDATTTFRCEGKLPVGDRSMGCLGRHGDISLAEAVARSCNIYFYHVGRNLGIEPLLSICDTLGFGRRTGLVHWNPQLLALGVPVTSGLREAAPRFKPGPYSITNAMTMAIGQSPLDGATPLQVAAMMGAIGTGEYVAPQLVASVEGYGDVPSRPGVPLEIDVRHLQIVRAAMAEVVDRHYGTANDLALRHPEIAEHVAAKTGTAQDANRRDHSWFAGFMPREQPRLAFAVMIEDCGFHGSEAALPVFMDLLDRPAMAAFLDAEILPPGPDEVAR